jgi:dihydrofolate synthase / folylpolyglutamate synthase
MKFNSYNDCIKFLFSLERAGIKYDLKNITSLLKFLDNPQTKFKSIHIAGTNGKGSVAAIINSILLEAGFKTGLFTSPHLIDLRERFLFNGKYVSKKFITGFTNKIYEQIQKIKPSFFEVTTALAFDFFKEKKVDYAVIETGLGGRLDSTNIINPVISIITGIGIEHTEYLGDTIESITKEKGGIIKKRIPVVVGKVPVISSVILKEIAKKNKSEIIFADEVADCEIIKRDENGFVFNFFFNPPNPPLSRGALEGNPPLRVNDSIESLTNSTLKRGALDENVFILENFRFPLIGDFQRENIKTAFAALSKLDIKIRKEAIGKGLKNLKINSRFRGRFEVIGKNPYIIVDVSHNEQGIKNIKNNLNYIKHKKLFIIFGMMEDKNFAKCINELIKLKGEIILTKPENIKAALPEKIYEKAIVKKSISIKENIKQSYDYARSRMKKKDLLLVTGSFYLAGEFLSVVSAQTSSSS